MIAMGVANWGMFALTFACVAAFAGLCLAIWRVERPGDGAPVLMAAAASLVATLQTTAFGPLVATPAIATMLTALFMNPARRYRWAIFAFGCLPILAPALAEWLGLIAPSYAFDGHALLVLPRMLSLPSAPTQAMLLLLSLVNVGVVAAMTAHHQRFLGDVEQRLVVQAWQLRKLASVG
jgi:hypothetical protein